jgi:hypothetical protein
MSVAPMLVLLPAAIWKGTVGLGFADRPKTVHT